MAKVSNNNKTAQQTISVVLTNVDSMLSILQNMATVQISQDVEYTHLVEYDILTFVEATEDYLTHQVASKVVSADLPVDQSKDLIVRITEHVERAKKIYSQTPQTSFTRMSVKMQSTLYKQSNQLVEKLQSWYAENLIRSL